MIHAFGPMHVLLTNALAEQMVQEDGPHGMSHSLGPGSTASHALLNEIFWFVIRKLDFQLQRSLSDPQGLIRERNHVGCIYTSVEIIMIIIFFNRNSI